MLVIGMTGAGGVGKTSILEAIKKIGDDRFCYFPSVVRGVYADLGYQSEKEIYEKLGEEGLLHFQLTLYNTYKTKFKTFIEDNSTGNYKLMICDRTLADHLAYILYVSSRILKLEKLRELLEETTDFLVNYDAVIYFPYPTPWSTEQGDGFRWIPPAKNYIIDSLVWNICSEPKLKKMIHLHPESSIQNRVDQVLAFVHKMLFDSSFQEVGHHDC